MPRFRALTVVAREEEKITLKSRVLTVVAREGERKEHLDLCH